MTKVQGVMRVQMISVTVIAWTRAMRSWTGLSRQLSHGKVKRRFAVPAE